MTDAVSQPRRRYFGGVCALIGVVFIWVSSSFAMNSIFGEQNFNKPFMITYLNTATFSLYLIPLLFRRKKQHFSPEEYAKLNMDSSSSRYDEDTIRSMEEPDASAPEPEDKLNTRETIRLSLIFCIVWFIANYTTNASLAYTTVGSSTILSSTSGLFTLAIGSVFGVEKFSLVRVIAVAVSFIGVIFVSWSDQMASDHPDPNAGSGSGSSMTDEAHAPLLGDALALAGAICYGCYTTLLKLRIGDESRINMPLFFGFVGAFNLLLLWPFFIILHYTGLEPFSLPHGGLLWATMLLNAFIGTFLSDYLWLLAMLMTSPLVVTLGISLTIPLALVGDVIFKHIIPGLNYAFGAILVVGGFFAVNMATLSDVDEDAAYAERQLVPSEGDDSEQADLERQSAEQQHR